MNKEEKNKKDSTIEGNNILIHSKQGAKGTPSISLQDLIAKKEKQAKKE